VSPTTYDTVTYDTGALIAAERNERGMWALHLGYLAEDVIPIVPAPVVAEAWRGGSRQASLARLLAGCEIEPMSADQARQVGELVGRARLSDIVAVTVVEGAIRRGGDPVVTANPTHIRQVAEGPGRPLHLEVI
jgi:hypothetical protein